MNLLRDIFTAAFVFCLVAFMVNVPSQASSGDDEDEDRRPTRRTDSRISYYFSFDDIFMNVGGLPGRYGGSSWYWYSSGNFLGAAEGGLNEDKDNEGEDEECRAGNPVLVASGIKVESVTDIAGVGNIPLSVTRNVVA